MNLCLPNLDYDKGFYASSYSLYFHCNAALLSQCDNLSSLNSRIFIKFHEISKSSRAEIEFQKISMISANNRHINFLFVGNSTIYSSVTIQEIFAVKICMRMTLNFKMCQGQMQICQLKQQTSCVMAVVIFIQFVTIYKIIKVNNNNNSTNSCQGHM